jgi:hypothetical protein
MALAQQRVEVAGHIVTAAPLTGNH